MTPEYLATVRAKLNAAHASRNALDATLVAEDRTLSHDERTEHNRLSEIISSCEATIATANRAAADTARPVAARQLPRVSVAAGAPAILTRTNQAQRNGDAWKGQSGYRLWAAKIRSALAVKNGEILTPAQVAADAYPDRPELSQILTAQATNRRRKAADMTGGGTGSGDWGHELLQLDAQFVGDFVEYLYSDTVFDKLPFRRVPSDVTIKGQDGASTAYWVGEQKAIPMTNLSASDVTLRRLKVAALAAVSRDLLERSAPGAETIVAESLRNAISQKVDGTAFSTSAASAGVSPVGFLNSISGHASAGGTLQNLYSDIGTLMATFIAAKNTGGLHFVSDKTVATQIGLLLSEITGQPVFPDVSENGGTLHKKPYVTGDNVPAENLIVLKPSDIWIIGDSGVRMDLSTEATLEFGTAPTAAGDVPTDQSENPVSLFQTDQIAIKLTRDIDWQFRRAQNIVVDRITNADYDGTANTTD